MFQSKNKKKCLPRKPQFYYIKVGCKGVFVTRTCFRDVEPKSVGLGCVIISCLSVCPILISLETDRELNTIAVPKGKNSFRMLYIWKACQFSNIFSSSSLKMFSIRLLSFCQVSDQIDMHWIIPAFRCL